MDVTINLIDAIPYLRAYHGQTFVIKAGGDLLGQASWRSGLARDLTAMHRLGIRVVFVHGGGPQLDAALADSGIAVRRVAGRRVTCRDTINLAAPLWSETVAGAWVEAIEQAGEPARAITGTQGSHVEAVRRPPVSLIDENGSEGEVDFGFVGDVVSVDADAIESLLEKGLIPVISPLAMDAQGSVLNVNADTIAAEVAKAVGAAKLILMTRAAGILSDPMDENSALHWADLAELDRLQAEGVLSGGMLPKVDAIRGALQGGVARVHVVDGRRRGALLEEVFTTQGSGTLVVGSSAGTPPELVDPL